MTTNKTDWTRFHGTFNADPSKKVVGVDVQIEANDTVSSTNGIDRVPIYFTDLQFQAGDTLSGWIPNTKEMLKKLSWKHDENTNVPTVNSWDTVEDPDPKNSPPPQVFENVEKRRFNIVGRGHQSFVLPNYMPEDWSIPILPTGVDIRLIAKDDFDLVRISSGYGVTLPEEFHRYKAEGGLYQQAKERYEQASKLNPLESGNQKIIDLETSNWTNIFKPLLDNHPLDNKFTREFYVGGGKAGSEIVLNATNRHATLNGVELPIVGQREIKVNNSSFKIERQKFMMATKGSSVIRIEFYKQLSREITYYNSDGKRVKAEIKYLSDIGIGYYGTAEFHQWTYGRSRI